MASVLRALAPAKLNLVLRVARVGADGYHPLLSWFVTIGLHDEITFERTDGDAIRVECDEPSIPTDERNLVVRAALALRRAAPTGAGGARIALRKRIPAGGGLGGGSSDAAATLRALRRLWRVQVGEGELESIARTLGSDVPFFLRGGSCVGTGRGERLRPVAAPAARAALLLLPGASLSTAEVYRRFDAMRLGRDDAGTDEPDWAALARLGAADLLERLENDLESAALDLCPSLWAARDAAARRLGRRVVMTGSGSTLFSLFDAEPDAEDAAKLLSDLPLRTAVAAVPAPGGGAETPLV